MEKWQIKDISKAKYIGMLEIEESEDIFEVVQTDKHLVFGSSTNIGLLQSGFIEIDPVQVGLFFTLMHKRHKQKTTLITSNLGFDQWGSFLKNTQLNAALVDRLTENSHVINMKDCKSLRTRLDQQESF